MKPAAGLPYPALELKPENRYNRARMKTNIHPKWYPNAKVVCACGNTFTIGSTKEEIRVEVCSQCHPFFTGQQKFVDTLGRVEKFQKRQKAAAGKAVSKKKKKLLKKIEETKAEEKRPKTLKEMLEKRKEIREKS